MTGVPLSINVIPAAPTNLQAAVYSSTEADLAWTNHSQSASGYSILRSLNGGAFAAIASVDASTSSYSDTSLSPSDTAQYEVFSTGASDTIMSSLASSSSVTTPTGKPSITSLVQGSVTDPTGTSGTLTFTYQGRDYSGFEIEMQDTNTGENFHTISTNPDLTVDNSGPISVTTGTCTAKDLIGGDTYAFRIRADHTDGTVSDYVSANPPLKIQQSDAPTLTVTNFTQGYDFLRVGWSGAYGGIIMQESRMPCRVTLSGMVWVMARTTIIPTT